jgi:hypothetical protein
MVAERDAEGEAVVDAVVVDFADVVVEAAGAGHGAADGRAESKFAGEDADALGALHQDFIADEQVFELVEEAGEFGDEGFSLGEPAGG